MILLSSAILLNTPTSYGVALEESTVHEQPYAQACIYYRGAGRAQTPLTPCMLRGHFYS